MIRALLLALILAAAPALAQSPPAITTQSLNVLAFGAKGDGTSNDTSAIQAAATACPVSGCVLLFPPGRTFGITSAIQLASHTHVVATGATVLALPGLSGALFQNAHHTATTITDTDITFEGGTLDYGASGAQGGAHAIEMSFVDHVVVAHVVGQGRGPTAAATGTFTVSGGAVTAVALTAPGSGYAGASSGSLIFRDAGSGTGAAGSFSVAGGVVATVARSSGGSGYTDGTYSLGFSYGAGNFTAMIGCNDTLTDGVSAFGYQNATFDHWWNPKNARVVNSYAVTASTAQFVNFNTAATVGSTGVLADGFVLANNTLICNQAISCPIFPSPLESGTAVKNVTITGNILKNTFIAVHGATSNVSITGNVFIASRGGAAVIDAYPYRGGTPDGFTIAGNTFIDPDTTAPQEAVIRVNATNTTITGNTITGSLFYAATQTGANAAVIADNSFAPGANGFANLGTAWTSDANSKLPDYTVATLPTCWALVRGRMVRVSDATAPTYNGALTGGGAVAVPVFCDGSAWTAH